jgi:hypothetical protein
MLDNRKLLKRKGDSGRNQQVFKALQYADEEERRYTIEDNKRNYSHRGSEAMARRGDHDTADEAARSLSRAEVTRIEGVVERALQARRFSGGTWDELEGLTGLPKASISPRFKPLRRQLRICFALEPDVAQPELVFGAAPRALGDKEP